MMTDEERLAKKREYNHLYNEKQKQMMTDEERRAKRREYNRRYFAKYPEMADKRRMNKSTPEYRAKRRAKYAEAHKDDPMTEHRRKILETNAKKAQGLPTHEIKVYETVYQESEDKSEKKRQMVVEYIKKWSISPRNAKYMNISDRIYYSGQAKYYIRMQEQYATADISDKNNIALKMRAIENKFEELYKQLNSKKR